MTSEEKNSYNNNKNHKYKKDQIILNINYNTETGKLILSDNYNNHYLCDLFGRIKTKFLPNVAGQASFTQRQNYFSRNKKLQQKELFNRPNTSKPLYLGEKGSVDYHPTTRRFEGYSKFPRPLSPPFSNIPEHQMKEQIKKDLIQNLEKYFSEKNTKNIILNNNFNLGLSYLTADLNEFDSMKVDNERILELINQTLNTIKEKNILTINKYNKLPIVKALTQFSTFLLANKDTTIINNRQLSKPNSQIQKRYNYIQSAISRHGLKTKNKYNNKNKLTLNDNNIINIKQKINFRNLTLDSNKKYTKNNKINKNDLLKKLFKSKNNDLTLGKKIYMDFGSFSYEEEEKRRQNNHIPLTQENNNNVKINMNKEFTEATKETEESNFLDKKEKRYQTINDEKKENDLSFISNMSENEKKYEKQNSKPLKGLKYMNNYFNKEKKLLKGFQIEERKGFMYLFKNIRPKYKNNGELYEEDMELLKRTNPIAFKIQEKKNEFDLKQLMKKVNTQRINADNIMKGKKLKIQSIDIDE